MVLLKTILFNGSIGDWFRTTVGVRQGCLLSPTLFNIFLERIMIHIKKEKNFSGSGGGVGGVSEWWTIWDSSGGLVQCREDSPQDPPGAGTSGDVVSRGTFLRFKPSSRGCSQVGDIWDTTPALRPRMNPSMWTLRCRCWLL